MAMTQREKLIAAFDAPDSLIEYTEYKRVFNLALAGMGFSWIEYLMGIGTGGAFAFLVWVVREAVHK